MKIKTEQQGGLSMWIAKDEDGRVYLYNTKPDKDEEVGEWLSGDPHYTARINSDKLPKSINPKWTDPEPIEVKFVRKNK